MIFKFWCRVVLCVPKLRHPASPPTASTATFTSSIFPCWEAPRKDVFGQVSQKIENLILENSTSFLWFCVFFGTTSTISTVRVVHPSQPLPPGLCPSLTSAVIRPLRSYALASAWLLRHKIHKNSRGEEDVIWRFSIVLDRDMWYIISY